jgi:NTP pyrophosphatase (non-canonical NTP hydrolase)
VGEFAEAVFRFRGRHTDEDLAHIKREAADVFSCFMGVCNSARISYAKEAESMFKDGCHVCHTKPCTCTYARALSFKS